MRLKICCLNLNIKTIIMNKENSNANELHKFVTTARLEKFE